MKKIKYLSIILPALMLLAGCQKQMDIQRDDRVESVKSIFERLDRAYEALRTAYYVPATSGTQYGFSASGHMLAAYCDEAQEVRQSSSVYDYYNARVSSSAMPLWYVGEWGGTERWSGLFHTIDLCNQALVWLEDENLQTDYEKSQQKGMAAQFYAIRAYSYLQLIKRWGGVPIMNEPIAKDHDYSNDKRASFAQCVDFIIESCDSALDATDDLTPDGLPWFASGSQSWQLPRFGRAAIWAIKSQAALYAASPLWAGDFEGTMPYTWERVAVICKEALDQAVGHGAALITDQTVFPVETDFGLNPYDKYFLASYQPSSWDTETLYQSYNYGYYQSQVWQYAGLPLDPGQVSAGACPTQEMIDAYEVVSADGTRAVPLLDLNKPYNADGTPNINPEAIALGYDDLTDKMYQNRDPRFYSTVYYDGVKVDLATTEDFEIQTRVGGNCALNLSPSNSRFTCTGYYLRKFSNVQSGAEAGNKDGYIRTYRLAELYLNFAEASFKAYGADYRMEATSDVIKDNDGIVQPVIYGEPMSAREAVNAVRARVGMPGIEDNGDDFWLRLCNERRVELAFEEHRFFDVRRWTKPDGDLSSTDMRVSGIRIEEQNGTKKYTRFSFDRECYTNKFLKYPVSLDEVRKMFSLTGEDWQNDGWN